MTDQELKDLVASLAVQSRETNRIVDKNAIAQEKTDRQIDKLEASLKKLEIQVGGINDNIGYHAEQFFQNVFEDKLEFGRIKYDEMVPNLAYRDKGVKIEFDIALINGDSIALIEVKNRIHPNFVIELAEERVVKFREFFPRYSNYDVYLGIAGFSFCEEVLGQASKYGIGIIGQAGEGIEVKADCLRVY